MASALLAGLTLRAQAAIQQGAALNTSAIGAGCTRCDAAAIVPYLQTLD
jgi:hypothetical protein